MEKSVSEHIEQLVLAFGAQQMNVRQKQGSRMGDGDQPLLRGRYIGAEDELRLRNQGDGA